MKEKTSIKNMRSKIGLSQVVVFIAFSMLSFLIATFFAPIVSSDATTNTTTSGNSAYSASISAEDSVLIDIAPTIEQKVFSGTNTISYTNTCPSGFTIYIETNDDTTALTREGSDSFTKEIPTISAGTALADNTWGYTTGSGTSGNTSYYPIPSKSAPAVLFNATGANTTAKTLVTVKSNSEQKHRVRRDSDAVPYNRNQFVLHIVGAYQGSSSWTFSG